MSCERCGGLMVVDIVCDLMEEKSRRRCETTRCLNCGNVEDTIICTNRIIAAVRRYVESHTVGTRRLSASQPLSLDRARPTDGVISENPRGRAPRLPVGPSSAETRTLEPAHIGQLTPIIHTDP